MIHSRPSKWIQKGSSFAALRHLPRVAPEFVFREHSWAIEREVLHAFESVAQGVEIPLNGVVGARFNDGQLNSVELAANSVIATVNHFGLECLFSWLYQEIRAQAFPIEITFNDVDELVLLRSTEQASYQRIRSNLRQTLRAGGQLIRIECIKSEPNSNSCVIGFRTDNEFRRSSKPPTDWYINDYWLLMKSGDIQVENKFRSSLETAFKPEHHALIEPFLTDYDNHDWNTFFPFESWLSERGC